LIVAFSAPALAALGKAQNRPDQRHLESTSELQWKWGNAQPRLNRRQVGDPYWTGATTPPPTAPTAASRSASHCSRQLA
jgi:hypothetical protein